MRKGADEVATLEITRSGDQVETLALNGRPLWLCEGRPSSPEDADLCVIAKRNHVWALIAPAADAGAKSRGRPVLGGMTDLLAAPLTLNGSRYRARTDRHGPRIRCAETASHCPVCRQGIGAGDECYVCSCGAITDSRFCAVGGREAARCFGCDAHLEREERRE